MKQPSHDAPLPENLRLNPHARLCPRYDAFSNAMYRLPSKDWVGWQVVDNFPEEHIQ